ncbi:MAG TPA: type II toxin-antitoxin system HicA family toxin [Patescibacteria group bacterium]|nr:type II toxin-antitoxin system HicA family toxin [Patescibacteria group bacterium]
MKRIDLLRHLTHNGCRLLREGANHSWWHLPQSGARPSVPRHNEINNPLAKKICRDLGIAEPTAF